MITSDKKDVNDRLSQLLAFADALAQEKIKELEEKLADCQKGVRNAAEINRLLANRNDDLKQQLVDYETDWRKMRKYYDGAMVKMAIAIEALEKADKTLSLTYYSFQPVRQDINEALEKIKR